LTAAVFGRILAAHEKTETRRQDYIRGIIRRRFKLQFIRGENLF